MEEPVLLLERVLEKIAKEQNYENYKPIIKQISTSGANTGYLFKVSIIESGRNKLHLFAKVSAFGEKMRKKTKLYKNESYFYNDLIKKYKKLEKNHNVPKKDILMIPRFFGGCEEYMKEVLVLEDLSVKGFEEFNRFDSVNWEEASKSVEQLAKFHALSIALFSKNLNEFKEAAEACKAVDSTGENFKCFLKSIIPKVCEATCDEDKERVATFLQKMINSENFRYIVTPIKISVIIHGDYKPSNLMYKNKEPYQAIPLDFQTLRPGSPLYDLLYFINLGSDNKFRLKYFQAIIDHYYSELRSALRRLDVDPDEVYNKDDFDYEYQQILPYLLMVSMCVLLVMTVDEECAPKGKELGDVDLDSYAFTPNQSYKDKLAELIEFYSNMGVL